jgi:leucyl aminopeptidase
MIINHAALSSRHQMVIHCLGADEALLSSYPEVLRQHVSDALADKAQVVLPTLGYLPQAWLLVTRLPQDAVAIRRRGGVVAKAVVAQGLERVYLAPLPSSEVANALELFALGFNQGAYGFSRYIAKAGKARPTLSTADKLSTALRQRVQSETALVDACRDLINTPAMDCGPADVVVQARKLAKGSGVTLKVFNQAELKQKGCGCILSVGAAASRNRAPRLLVLDYKGKTKDHVALCGKGVCFDTGGVQVKPGSAMMLMRKDMGGAATVLAAVLAHAKAQGKQSVKAYIPLVENAIAGDAFRPGDVLTAADGTTIEVGHTDAEGRLVLADALSLAREAKPKALLTVATLTGAALVALGRIHVPLMATDDDLSADLEAAAAASGEKVWRLPLDEDHHALVRNSKLAMLTNSAGPDASCITAGAFLAHFAGDTPFAHFDISPASWKDSAHDLGPAGATGVMVDSLRRYLAG